MSVEGILDEVRKTQNESLDDGAARARVRQRLLAEPRRRQNKRLRYVTLAAVCILGVSVGLSGVFAPAPEPLAYEVDVAAERPNGVVADGESVSVAFSDGSNVVLAPGSHASVPATTPVGATVVVERGHVFFDVEHQEQTDWQVRAGPYVVHVVGTSFDVGWDAETHIFELHVREGEVRLQGQGELRTVSTGERVTFGTVPEVDIEPTRETAVNDRTPEDNRAEPELAGALSPPLPSSARHAEVGWRELGQSGDVQGALRALNTQSFRRVLRRAEADELMLLGGWARRARDERARVVYEAVRARFRGTEPAANAAFLLGRMCSSQGEALRWWRVYETEAPGGRFARENAGRILESLQALGRDLELRRQAELYLARYASGPHADLAEAALQ